MEKASIEWEARTLINELTQGREIAKQLKSHLNPSSSSRETREFLLEKILSSYEKALSMLNWSAFLGDQQQAANNSGKLDSPCSLAGSLSPGSQGSHPDSKDQYHMDVFKKRKTTLPRWTEQVRISSENGQDGPLEDGYSWRKYGQKDILGANHPRGYYRCTHRHVQGCLATKQVQRSDEDPSIFVVTYRGSHTCIQASHSIPKLASPQENKRVPKQNKGSNHQEKQAQEMLLSFGVGLKVKNEGFDTTEDQMLPSFSFPLTPICSENVDEYIFSQPIGDNNFVGDFSPAFISPTTSESNYFSVSPCHMNNFGMAQNLHTSESDFTEIISAPTSVTGLPTGDLDISLDPVDFDSNFPFDSPEFFA